MWIFAGGKREMLKKMKENIKNMEDFAIYKSKILFTKAFIK